MRRVTNYDERKERRRAIAVRVVAILFLLGLFVIQQRRVIAYQDIIYNRELMRTREIVQSKQDSLWAVEYRLVGKPNYSYYAWPPEERPRYERFWHRYEWYEQGKLRDGEHE